MGTLACSLKEMGYTVTGSDQNVYPPMSDFLKEKGIELFQGYDPSHLHHSPDLVVIGNAVTRMNPEAEAALNSGIPYMSMPQAVNQFIAKDKKIILVTGTHGKTTTSSILSHILYTAGMDPSFLIGGILKDFNSSFKIGSGDYMVIEGDEYDTAFFDKGPKFMHYNPEIIIMTGIEFDHADIFTDIEHVKQVFSALIQKNETRSYFIAFEDSLHLKEVLSRFSTALATYGENAQWTFSGHCQKESRTYFDVHGPGESMSVETGLAGRHNLYNIMACIAAAQKIGITHKIIKASLNTFSGVKRRQEVRGIKNGITVMDDFAHHPTAVHETIRALKPFYQEGRIIAVFEPRTNTSMRNFFQASYPDAFVGADMVCICEPSVKKDIPEQERLSIQKLITDINKKGINALYFENTGRLLNFLESELKDKDLALIMSNGGFDNIHEKLLERI
nr:UDP-N-acetylmuramate:L-alanyl-gamma-D-glutamyl-meso-diaminopimelate ligase [Desulfobacula sp.]